MECGHRTLGKTNRTWVNVLSKEKHYTQRQCVNFLYILKNVTKVAEVAMSQNVEVSEYVTKVAKVAESNECTTEGHRKSQKNGGRVAYCLKAKT